MSLARMALRLAAYEALNPYPTMQTGPWPTIAGKNVFDSRVDLLQEDDKPDIAAELEGKPLLIVYTEEDIATPYQGGRKVPDEQVVHLVVEAMIAARGEVDVPLPDGTTATVGTIEAPISDRQHEAMLDLLEALVRRLLDTRNLAPSSALYGQVALETRGIQSFPQRGSDRVTRMAARTIKFEVKVRPDTWPPFLANPAPTGLAMLPQPLQAVALGLPAGSSGLAVCQQTAASLQPPMPQPTTPLQIAIVSDLDQHPGNAAPIQTSSLVVVGPATPPLDQPAPPEPSP